MVELIRELIREIRYEFRMMDNYQNVKSLHKDDQGLLIMLDGCECEKCESCSIVCDTGALSVEWEDGDDLSMIKYIGQGMEAPFSQYYLNEAPSKRSSNYF